MNRLQYASLAIALIALATGGAFAQDEPRPAEQAPDAANKQYRIGLACGEVSEALRVHLNIPRDQGLLVNAVLDNSPAGRAGIQRFDIVTHADDTPVGNVRDLVDIVNQAQNTELELTLIRKGQPQTVNVTPEERGPDELSNLGVRRPWGRFEELPPQLRQQLEAWEEFGPPTGPNGLTWRRFLPGIIMDGPESPRQPLPDNFSLQVEKSGDGPAKIKVRRGNERWEVTEDTLDELPEDVRAIVEHGLNRSPDGLPGLGFGNRPTPPRGPNAPDARNRDPALQQRFDGIELRLRELQDAIRAMRDNGQ